MEFSTLTKLKLKLLLLLANLYLVVFCMQFLEPFFPDSFRGIMYGLPCILGVLTYKKFGPAALQMRFFTPIAICTFLLLLTTFTWFKLLPLDFTHIIHFPMTLLVLILTMLVPVVFVMMASEEKLLRY